MVSLDLVCSLFMAQKYVVTLAFLFCFCNDFLSGAFAISVAVLFLTCVPPLSPLEHLNLNCQARLEGMRARLLSKSGALLNLSADSATLASTQPAVEAFVKALPEAPSASEVCA